MKFPTDRPVKVVMLGAGGTGGYVAPYVFRLLHMLDASAGYRGILCVGILRDRPARGQGGINSDSAKNGKEQFFEKDRAVSNYQPDAFGLQVL